ncbi:hypothetical protein FNV43_RR17079 [Rhamnella rubrinervis]|uniref:Uncharacterized protein n=1 Tax=Rhamnella rubrinervis TaxID=2594499 RepID=A0A8K0H034_9ROSA|nr:hypothetical protein FNV43_RR17079 [Rhamnella rubrinervis]
MQDKIHISDVGKWSAKASPLLLEVPFDFPLKRLEELAFLSLLLPLLSQELFSPSLCNDGRQPRELCVFGSTHKVQYREFQKQNLTFQISTYSGSSKLVPIRFWRRTLICYKAYTQVPKKNNRLYVVKPFVGGVSHRLVLLTPPLKLNVSAFEATKEAI